jgi:hypothetical protein
MGKINFDKIYEVFIELLRNDVSNVLSLESINDIDMQTRIEAKKVVKSLN